MSAAKRHRLSQGLGYAKNAEAVTFAVGEKWTWNGDCGVLPHGSSYDVTFAREFRYDGARARYLVRELNPVNFRAGGYVVVDDVYTDYDGDEAYGDWRVEAFQPPSGPPVYYGETMRSFEPGLGTFEYEANPAFDPACNPLVNPGCSLLPTRPDASTVKFYHGDHLGTTRFMTDAGGTAVQSSVYSAFGMRVSGTNHRYGYDGAWGYQSHSFDEVPFGMNPDTAFPFLHVGHRYYDPSTGRFLQRDPIGIDGGLNVFAYVLSSPTRFVDDSGSRPHDGLTNEIIWRDRRKREPVEPVQPAPPKKPVLTVPPRYDPDDQFDCAGQCAEDCLTATPVRGSHNLCVGKCIEKLCND
jgi:RHS repeat-associated protein